MSIIKILSDPTGTFQLVRMIATKGEATWHRYRVIATTGAATHAPSPDGSVVYLELAERNPGWLQSYISLPLTAFDSRVVAVSKDDKFWGSGKQSMDT